MSLTLFRTNSYSPCKRLIPNNYRFFSNCGNNHRQQQPSKIIYFKNSGSGQGSRFNKYGLTNKVLIRGGLAFTAFSTYYYFNHLETVPISGRSRFMSVSKQEEEMISRASYNEIMNSFRGRFLPHYHPYHQQVTRVAERIIRVAGMQDLNWEIQVIDEDEVNAFVLPGGKIFVFTGILRITDNDDQLAAVLGHEVAHQIARHSAEKLSLFKAVFWAKLVASIFFDPSFIFNALIFNLGINLPFSRKCESEADYIGLLLMSQACYNPRESIKFWQQMSQFHKGQGTQFLSTHPSPSRRIEKLQEWMGEALVKYNNSDCNQYMYELDRMFSQGFQKRWANW